MPEELLVDVNIGMQLMSSLIKIPGAAPSRSSGNEGCGLALPVTPGPAAPVAPGPHTAAADTANNECELEHQKCNFIMLECRSEI